MAWVAEYHLEADEIAKVIVEEGVSVVTAGAGNSGKYLAAWKEAGIKAVPVVASIAFARMIERLTLDALRKAVIEGDTVNGSLMAGKIAGMVKEEMTCAEMVREIMQQA